MEKKVFFLLKLKTKIKARWIEHIMKTQIGINLAVINFDKRVLLVEYDSKLITSQYMRMLVRSLGCDLIVDDKEVQKKQNQLGNLNVLKRRVLFSYLISFISIIELFCPFSNFILLFSSVLMFILYFSMFFKVSNDHFKRPYGAIDLLGGFIALLPIIVDFILLLFFVDILSEIICLFSSIVIVQILFIVRYIQEIKTAKTEQL